jgi:hypothetical protein
MTSIILMIYGHLNSREENGNVFAISGGVSLIEWNCYCEID